MSLCFTTNVKEIKETYRSDDNQWMQDALSEDWMSDISRPEHIDDPSMRGKKSKLSYLRDDYHGESEKSWKIYNRDP